jgi:hypothetical protein
MHFLAALILSHFLPAPAHAAFFYPDALASSLEHILVDTHGAYASGFADASRRARTTSPEHRRSGAKRLRSGSALRFMIS